MLAALQIALPAGAISPGAMDHLGKLISMLVVTCRIAGVTGVIVAGKSHINPIKGIKRGTIAALASTIPTSLFTAIILNSESGIIYTAGAWIAYNLLGCAIAGALSAVTAVGGRRLILWPSQKLGNDKQT
jgi:hypothetical protein